MLVGVNTPCTRRIRGVSTAVPLLGTISPVNGSVAENGSLVANIEQFVGDDVTGWAAIIVEGGVEVSAAAIRTTG